MISLHIMQIQTDIISNRKVFMYKIKRSFKERILSLIMAIALMVTMMPLSMLDVYGADSSTSSASVAGLTYNGEPVLRGFTPYNGNLGTENTITYYYSDGYFKSKPTVKNDHLRSFAYNLAISTNHSKMTYAKNVLNSIGCTNIEGRNAGVTSETTIGAVFGKKILFEGTSDECVLIPVAIRGGYYGNEWMNNFEMGNSTGDVTGFSGAADKVINGDPNGDKNCINTFISKYVDEKYVSGKKIKFIVAGYSRGGSVANIVGKKLSDTYGNDNVYGYSFESQKLTDSTSAGTYTNLNVVNNYSDVIAMLYPEYLGFKCYGKETIIGDTTASDYTSREDAMKKQLALVSQGSANYQSPTGFQYYKINPKITDLTTINLSLLSLASDIKKIKAVTDDDDLQIFISDDTSTQNYNQRDCFELLGANDNTVGKQGNRLKKYALIDRNAYLTNTGNRFVSNSTTAVKINNAALPNTTAYTTEQIAKRLAYYIENWDSIVDNDTVDIIEENFKKFPYEYYLDEDLKLSSIFNIDKTNTGKLLGLARFLTTMKFPTDCWSSYADMVEDVWDYLNTSQGDYLGLEDLAKSCPDITDEEIYDIKCAMPVLLYTLAAVFSQDVGKTPETIASVINNLERTVQQHYVEINGSWIRSEDSYYDNENMVPLSATKQVETNISNDESLTGTKITVMNGTSTLATIVDGVVQNPNSGVYVSSTKKDGKINELSIWTADNSNISVKIESTSDDKIDIDVIRRNYERTKAITNVTKSADQKSIDAAEISLYKGQSVDIDSTSQVEKTVTATLNANDSGVVNDPVLEDGKIKLSAKNNNNNYCIAWYIGDKLIGKGDYCEYAISYDMDNVAIEAKIYAEHKAAKKVAAVEATCQHAGNAAYWYCDTCDKYFSDAECTTRIAKDSWVIEQKKHVSEYHPFAKASFDKVGNSEYWSCKTCGEWFSDEECKQQLEASEKLTVVIPKAVAKFSNRTYTGKTQSAGLYVDGLKAGVDYTLTGAQNGVNIGTYSAGTVVLNNDKYEATKTFYYTINPKGTTIKTPKKAKKALTAKWKANKSKMPKARITGYQVQVAKNTAFTSGVKTATVKGYKKTSKKISKLSAKTRYYVRVRTYMKVGGKTYYSNWSGTKNVVTK